VPPAAPTDHAVMPAPPPRRRRRRRAGAWPAGVLSVVAVGVLAAGCGGSSGGGGGGGGGPAAGSGTKVTATETEFHIALSKSSYSPGTYTFTADNKGTLQHDLVINGPGVSNQKTPSLLAPGQTGSVTVTLEAGTYDIYCGVPGHKAEGMDVHITVK
jgi:plastocyanin